MIGIGLHIANRVMGGGGGFDADAQAFFDRVTTAGGTLTTTEKNATNQLVLDMKSAGIWTPMKAIYPMVGASAAACAQNLKSSSFTGTFSSGWTFASTGVRGNGSSTYMDTGINDLNDLGSTPTISVYLNLTGSNPGWQLGVFTSGTDLTGISVNNNATAANFINLRTAIGADFTETFTGGLYTGTTDSTNNIVYKNNVNKATALKISTGLNRNHYLGALNGNSGAFVWSDSRIASVFFGNQNLSSTNVSNLYTAVQAFQTTLSRQV